MPRSNKKKHPLKPQPKHPSSEEMMDCSPEISQIIINERTNMMNRAIHSAKHHGINLKPGPPTPGQGDCAFEAVINNNNERMCFKEKYSLSVTSYRQIWLTDMANRTVDTDWNIFSPQEWLTGWKDMLVPGTYERGIYGDLMLPGIACGVKKFILIFNTNSKSPHDPIYVVDPRKFNVHPDTAIPIILAYNLAHYESLHPITNADILATINLSKEYLENRYRYSKKDLPILLGLGNGYSKESNTKIDKSSQRKDEIKSSKTNYVVGQKKHGSIEKKMNLSNSDFDENDFVGHKSNDIDLDEIDNYLDEEIRKRKSESLSLTEVTNEPNLTYKLKNKIKEYNIDQKDGKMICPFCKISMKNIRIHFERKPSCGNQIDMNHFLSINTKYIQEKRRKQVRIAVEKRRTKLREENIEKFKWNHNENKKRNYAKRKAENPEQFKQHHNEVNERSRAKKKKEEPERSRKANIEAAEKSKKKKIENTTEKQRLSNFNKAILFGPIFICSCCKRKLYENGVSKITDEFKDIVNKKKENFFRSCIPSCELVKIIFNGSDEKSGFYICHTCKSTMKTGKMPSMSIMNGLHLSNILEEGHLTELENNLIAQNINFQYIFCLKKSRWAATKKQMISVPVTVEKLIDTIHKLPRLPRDAGLIPVQLKRKKIYKRCHKNEYVNPKKIFKVLQHLKHSGHPYYQFYDDFNAYKNRCKDQDDSGHSLLFEDEENSNDTEQENIDDEHTESEPEDENQREQDTIRKHQFDYNRNTCLTNNYPEMLVDSSNNQQKVTEEQLEFAPAEGNYPTNLLQEKDWDIKSWPALHPDGQFGLHHKRKKRLTDQQYFEQRLLNKDTRFCNSPGYIFAAAAYIEHKQLSSKANISFMRGKKSTNAEGARQYELDDAFTTFDGVRNTPKYWQKVKYEMIAKLENLGPFQMFFTLSCGDTRYDENFSTFLVENGYILEYKILSDGSTETIVKGKDERIIDKSMKEFLEQDVDESLHELIRSNVLTATRNFQHRVDAFRNEIIMGKNNPMKVKHISYRVEFQGRGAAHIHGTLWLDIKEIEKSKTFSEKRKGENEGYLVEAFRKLRDNAKLSEKEKTTIATLTDLFVSCSLNPDTIHENGQIGKRIVEIVSTVNCHHCTGPCNRFGDKCKYGFPRYPLKDTLVVDKNEFNDSAEIENEDDEVNHRQLLSDVEAILKDEQRTKEIMGKFEKGQTKLKYIENRGKRIDMMLEMAGSYKYCDYILAIKKTRIHGSTVHLQRDIDEIYVNNYNPEWIMAWNANLDLQPVLDFFAVITYVTDYWAKSDEGITQHLKDAASVLKSEPNQQKRCQQLANTFLTHRQMSESEAYYKILPHLKMKYSNVATIFIPTDKKELRSKFLMKLDETDASYSKGATVKGGKDGIFIEKPDIVDKFCRRKITEKNPELNKLPMIQFSKMYDPIKRKKSSEIEHEGDNTNEDENERESSEESQNIEVGELWKDEEDRVANFYITGDPNYNYIRLPKIIKLNNCAEGEVTLMEKRTFPKVARMHKKREDNNPHRYFLSELMLYTGYTDEKQLGCDDEDLCRELYLKNKDKIQLVKSCMMPFTDGVEEARHYVQQATDKEYLTNNNIGNILDSEKEQEVVECQDISDLDAHPDFVQVDPDELDIDSNLTQIRKTFRNIEEKTYDDIVKEARNLDEFQKSALNIIIEYVQDIIISRKAKIPYPKAPLLMINGGAGSGKSTLISAIYQYSQHFLRKGGDSPDCPYVLLGAYTGAAASNIKGQTLHTLFSFNFGAGYMSLSDRQRDEKRAMYKNLKILIIDEISLVDADMFYKIDLRLREIMQRQAPFGNVAVIVLGDVMQMCPISGRYIFLPPRNTQFHLTYELDPLWEKFDVITLEMNHRQGEDREYANTLNRIRVGQETESDIEKLKDRVRNKKHPDIIKERDALYIFGTNALVNKMNDQRLTAIRGEERIIKAICLHKSIKKFDPPVGKGGEVGKTSFQKELRLKIGAKVMLTYNIDTSDGLTNGARGELIGIIDDSRGMISKLIVKFEDKTIGQEKRRQDKELSRKYVNGTAIEKVNYPFSLSKSKKSVVNTANVIQFPIRLAFACTSHKVQGATILKPRKAIINVTDTFAAAMLYVMFSRVCSLQQIFILNKFDEKKMYPNKRALQELERLEIKSLNQNPTNWEKENNKKQLKISSLNCRSLKKHIDDIKSDKDLLKSDIICLQETWLENNTMSDDFQIENFELHLNSNGRGKGIAIYFKSRYFNHALDIKKQNLQLSKFCSPNIDVVTLYRSQVENVVHVSEELQNVITGEKPMIVIGDFNFCYLDPSLNSVKTFMRTKKFTQLIETPTHLEGNLLDHAYIRGPYECSAQVRGRYYTDHKSLHLILKERGEFNDISNQLIIIILILGKGD